VSAHGKIIRKTLISPDACEGVAVALGQWWPKLAPDKKSLNDLTGECLTDLGGGSTFGNATVVFVDEVGSSLKGVVGTTWAVLLQKSLQAAKRGFAAPVSVAQGVS